MNTDKSGIGYGNHGGDGSMGGQDNARSGDHVPGEDGTQTSEETNKGVDPTRTIPDDSGKGDYDEPGDGDSRS